MTGQTNRPNRRRMALEALSEDQLRRKLFKLEEHNPYRAPGTYSAIEKASKDELIEMWLYADETAREHDRLHDLECGNAAMAAVKERQRKHA